MNNKSFDRLTFTQQQTKRFLKAEKETESKVFELLFLALFVTRGNISLEHQGL